VTGGQASRDTMIPGDTIFSGKNGPKGLLDDQLYRRLLNGLQIVDCDCTPMVTHETSGKRFMSTYML
jgi:hypothetical protein